MLATLRATLGRLADRLFGPLDDPEEEFEPYEFGDIVDDDEMIERLRSRPIPADVLLPREEIARQSDEHIFRMLAGWRQETGEGVDITRDGDDHRWYPEGA